MNLPRRDCSPVATKQIENMSERDIDVNDSLDENLLKLFFDPQTAGGMLIATPASKAETLLATLRQNYPTAQIIGRIHPRGPHSIIVSKAG